MPEFIAPAQCVRFSVLPSCALSPDETTSEIMVPARDADISVPPRDDNEIIVPGANPEITVNR